MANNKEEGKKKMSKKLKPQKLEDRIAPGMIGSGVVDPGMADTMMDQPTDQTGDPNAGSTQETSIDNSSASGSSYEGQDGQYTEEHTDTTSGDTYSQDNQGAGDASAGYETIGGDYQGGDYTADTTSTWQETDWVTANADGSVHVDPPEGVSIDEGIASFPVDVANESLPLPEGVEIQTDGSVNVALPEGATYDADAGLLILPEGSVSMQEVPENLECFESPDGSLCIQMPEEGVTYLPESNTLNFDNALVNEMTPNNIEIQTDGSVCVTLPEEAQVNADGSIDLPQDTVSFMDNPPPDYVENVEWADVNTDGSITCTCPDGVVIEDGVATFPPDVAAEQLPIPEEVTLNSDGSLDIKVPDGTTWDADAGSLTFPEGSVQLDEIPEGVSAHINPDGTLTATLPDGMNYNAETASVHMDNYWANEMAPDPVAINTDGSVSVELPADTQYSADGAAFTLPPEQVDFVETPAPDYVHDVSFSEANDNGSYTVTPPPTAIVAEGTMEVPYNLAVETIPLPEEVTIHPDGTMDVQVPEGTIYNAVEGALTFPAGTVHMQDIPEGIETTLNADGTITAVLPDGMNYDAAAGSVHCDNYWCNEIMPPNVELTDSGSFKVDLPPDVQYHNDGSFTVPNSCADFIENPPPAYACGGPEWVYPNPGDSVTFEPPTGMTVDPEAGTFSMPANALPEHFDNCVPSDMQFHSDGTATYTVPEGAQYNAEVGVLTLPPGEVHMNEVPEGIKAELNDNGSVSITLPDGMSYNADAGTVQIDNYWLNQIAPEPVEFTLDGQCKVDLPEGTQYHDGGSFTVPTNASDFVDYPAPNYVSAGPDWMDYNTDGSVTIEPPAGMIVDADAGTASMSVDAFQENFGDVAPPEVTFNADGTADVQVPDGTQYNADTGTLTFPAGEVHMNEIPEGINTQLNADGTISVTLPSGMEYNAETGVVHMSNDWLNQFAPEPMEFQPDGQVVIQLPEGTQYFDGGACTIPADSANFMDEYKPYEGEAVGTGPQAATA